MYSCVHCGSRFTRKFNLTSHKDGRCKPVTGSKGLVSSNDMREQDVPRKRLWSDSSEMNVANKTSKPSRNPKIQFLVDEITNDCSTEDHTIPTPVRIHR